MVGGSFEARVKAAGAPIYGWEAKANLVEELLDAARQEGLT
jgi:hypothetical protein